MPGSGGPSPENLLNDRLNTRRLVIGGRMLHRTYVGIMERVQTTKMGAGH